jgi:hypothetical protein
VKLDAHGIVADLPRGWEGGIGLAEDARPDAVGPFSTDPRRRGRILPVTHLGNFPLPSERGDFGAEAIEVMSEPHAFVALLEYGPECAGTALFGDGGLPRRLRPNHFHPRSLQRVIRGQAGHQRFLTHAGRAFCLYVVLGDLRRAGDVVPEVNAVLSGITIEGAR